LFLGWGGARGGGGGGPGSRSGQAGVGWLGVRVAGVVAMDLGWGW
jgi:hypothetical protein